MRDRILHQSFLPASPGTDAYVWKYTPVDGGRRPRHFHAEPELNLVTRGWAEYGVGDTVVRVRAGELIGFPAGQDHVLLGASEDAFLYAVGVAPMLAAQVHYGTGQAAVPLHLNPGANEFAALERRAELILEQTGIEQPCAELWEQVQWLNRSNSRGRGGPMHALTKRALRALSDAPELTLEALASGARANPSEISRYFHRDLGMTFVRYRTRLRLLRFLELEKEQRGTWTDAAIASGFGSYSQFHRAFQAELGCSPRDFLRAGVSEQMQLVYEDDAG